MLAAAVLPPSLRTLPHSEISARAAPLSARAPVPTLSARAAALPRSLLPPLCARCLLLRDLCTHTAPLTRSLRALSRRSLRALPRSLRLWTMRALYCLTGIKCSLHILSWVNHPDTPDVHGRSYELGITTCAYVAY